jgi:putative transposase
MMSRQAAITLGWGVRHQSGHRKRRGWRWKSVPPGSRTRETYGSERLQEDLADNGVKTTVHRVKRIRRKLGIRCKQKRKFKATTNSNHTLPVAPNLLEQKFIATAPNQIWLTDITYIPTDEGWLYLAGHKDLFSGAWWAMP